MARFVKGKSGNPKGRPKLQPESLNLSEALRAKGSIDELANLIWQDARERKEYAIKILHRMLSQQATREGTHLGITDLTDQQLELIARGGLPEEKEPSESFAEQAQAAEGNEQASQSGADQ